MNIPEFTQSLAPNLKQHAGNHETCATRNSIRGLWFRAIQEVSSRESRGYKVRRVVFVLFKCPKMAKNWMVYWRRLVCSALRWSAKDWASASSHVSASRYLESTPYNSQVGQTYNFNSSKISVLDSGLTWSYRNTAPKKVYHSVIKHGHHKWRFHGEIMNK